MKLFSEEIEKFYLMLHDRQNFALARYGDGEMMAMRGETIASGYGEWNTNGADPRYEVARRLLYNSFTYIDPKYYVGIVCPCCQGDENFYNMKAVSCQFEENLTYANVFVNSNYGFFIEKFIPLFQNRDIVLVAHESSQVQNLPFSGEFYPVKYNAWIENVTLIEEIKTRNFRNKLFLFACGPLGKILAQQLWHHNKENSYLDVGSTLHPWLQSDRNIRGYYQTDDVFYKTKICNWGQ